MFKKQEEFSSLEHLLHHLTPVIPAKAGIIIQCLNIFSFYRILIPAFAGMTWRITFRLTLRESDSFSKGEKWHLKSIKNKRQTN